MICCPKCQAESVSAAGSCAQCNAELNVVQHDADRPTQRTRPKLLVLRPATEAPEPPTKQLPDPGIALIADQPATALLYSYRLKVLRGLRVSVEYPLYDGTNLIGRGDDRPVDIDLRDQEPLDRIWASRHHAIVTLADGALLVEDLNSTNGTYVNRHRLEPGSKRPLQTDDIIQIGTTQLKVTG